MFLLSRMADTDFRIRKGHACVKTESIIRKFSSLFQWKLHCSHASSLLYAIPWFTAGAGNSHTVRYLARPSIHSCWLRSLSLAVYLNSLLSGGFHWHCQVIGWEGEKARQCGEMLSLGLSFSSLLCQCWQKDIHIMLKDSASSASWAVLELQ